MKIIYWALFINWRRKTRRKTLMQTVVQELVGLMILEEQMDIVPVVRRNVNTEHNWRIRKSVHMKLRKISLMTQMTE